MPSGPTAFAFGIAFIAVAISSSVESIPRCGRLFGTSRSSMSDLAFSSERMNRTHLSRICILSRSSVPPSSRTHCDSSSFVSSSCTAVMFWKNPCWSPLRNYFSNSTTWRSKLRTNAALRTVFRQLHSFLAVLRNCASLVSVSRRWHAAWIAPVAICRSASAWASPLQPRSGLVRSWGGIANSVVRMMAAANATTTLPTLLSPGGFALGCLPTAVAPSCRNWGSVTRHLRSTGGLTGTLNRRFRAR